jgi:hypothetical protein
MMRAGSREKSSSRTAATSKTTSREQLARIRGATTVKRKEEGHD